MYTPAVRVSVSVALVLLVATSGGAGAARFAPAGAPGASVVGLLTDIVPLPPGAVATPLPAPASIQVSFTLSSRDPAGFSAFIADVSDPRAPEYRQFLTYPEVLAEFAPPPGAVEKVESSLRDAGATVTTVTADGFGVVARADPAAVHRLFGVSLVEYGELAGVPLYTATGTVDLDPALRGLVSEVQGLSDAGGLHLGSSAPGGGVLRTVRGTGAPHLFLLDNTSNSQWFLGSDFTQAYRATSLFPGSGTANATYPSSVAVATLLASGYNATTGQNLPPWDPTVVSAYFNDTLPSSWPTPRVEGVPVPIGSDVPPPPGSFGAVNDTTLDEFENSLDLEMAGSVAPGATVVNFYFSGDILVQTAPGLAVADDFAQSLSEALAYNYSPARLAVVSGSFGLPDLNCSNWDIELEVAAAMGVTVVISSGDQGDAPDSLTVYDDGPWPTWPASAAFNSSGAVAVGGVSLTLGGTPTATFQDSSSTLNLSYDPTVTGIASESAWYDAVPGQSIAGTEGGVSTVYPEPYWQVHSAAQPNIRNATIVQGVRPIGRAEPDVALPGNTTIAAVYANATESVFVAGFEGTSIAAPVFAGLLADLVGVASARSSIGWAPLGFFAPTLYRIASYFAAFPNASSDPFLDVENGSNHVFSAEPGWDALTGWGGVNVSRLLAAVEDPTVAGYNYTGPTPGLPPPATSSTPTVPWTEIYLIFGAGLVIAIVIVVLTARPTRPRAPSEVPFGAHGFGGPGSPPGGVAGGGYSGATFLCPYCGSVRPAEPVRCPRCGAY